MRILLTIHHKLDVNSGAPGAAIALAEALREKGHHVYVLSHDNLFAWADGKASIFAFPALVALFACSHRRDYDVLDFASSDGWLAAMLPRRCRPHLLIFHTHGLEHMDAVRLEEDSKRKGVRLWLKYRVYRGSIFLKQIQFAMKRADLALFLNRQEASYAVRCLGIPEEGALVVPNGVDEMFATLPLEVRSSEALGIAYIGTFLERKGVEYLVPALTTHLQNYPAAKVLMLGTGLDSGEVCAKFPVALRSRIVVIPRYERRDLPNLLKDSQVFVLPSLGEGFSLAFLEAMCCGLVPIVTRGFGFDDVIRDGESGILIDVRSSIQINESLDRLEQNPELCQSMREKALETARTYTWSNAAERRIAAYSEAERNLRNSL